MAATTSRGVVPYDFIEMLTQQPNEPQNRFLQRVAGKAWDYTKRTNQEACGRFCARTDGRQSIMLFTGVSQVSCPLMDICGGNHETRLPNYLHTHPAKHKFRLTALDAQIINERETWPKPATEGCRFRARNTEFSSFDYDQGPGYLVFDGKIWHQHGVGTQVLIGTTTQK